MINVRLLYFVIIICSQFAEAQTLRALISDPHRMPLVQNDNGVISSGIVFDTYKLIAEKTGAKIEFKTFSRKRSDEAILEHAVDIRCNINPNWTAHKDKVVWSQPIYAQKDLILSLAETKSITNVDGLKDSSLGIVLGFFYPKLEEPINKKLFTTVEVKTPNDSIKMLLNKRVKYAVVSEAIYLWYLKNNPTQKGAFRANFILESVDVFCTAHKDSLKNFPKLKDVVESLDRKQVEPILKKYLD